MTARPIVAIELVSGTLGVLHKSILNEALEKYVQKTAVGLRDDLDAVAEMVDGVCLVQRWLAE